MRALVYLLVLPALLRFGGAVLAQGYDAHWIFGDGYHIEFVDGEPQVLPFVEGYYAKEGSSCISDSTGSLLFYCNTQKVWNRENEILWNSDSLNTRDNMEGSSKTTGSMFLPHPGDSLDRYFALFVMNEDDHHLYYNLIDRSLDAGMGGIVSGRKNIRISIGPIGEQLTAVKHANGRDWWILGKTGYPVSNGIFTQLYTSDGFGEYSTYPSINSSIHFGEMSASSDGRFVAYISRQNSGVQFVCLYGFDRCTGQLNFIDTANSLTGSNEFYGLEFAPTEEMLYVSTERNHSLIQFDFSSGILVSDLLFRLDAPDIWPYENRCGQLELGLDGKIYMVMRRGIGDPDISLPVYDEYLAAVSFPDISGSTCDFDTFAVYLNGRMNRTGSLPVFPNYNLGPLLGSPCDTLSPPDTTQTSIPVFTNPSQGFTVFPSVSDGAFHVTSTISGTVRIMDLYGREWLEERISERRSFDLEGAPRGIYIVVLMDEGGTFIDSRKVILE